MTCKCNHSFKRDLVEYLQDAVQCDLGNRSCNNGIVRVGDNLASLGTGIKAQIPTILRKRQEKL